MQREDESDLEKMAEWVQNLLSSRIFVTIKISSKATTSDNKSIIELTNPSASLRLMKTH